MSGTRKRNKHQRFPKRPSLRPQRVYLGGEIHKTRKFEIVPAPEGNGTTAVEIHDLEPGLHKRTIA